ncbi:MAG: hypothetical protein DWQ05_12855 [Calditrichaeota bacterium]|nr:MAG: hypothetical protein DWQ05_12855 [Calditrichota bacterium]
MKYSIQPQILFCVFITYLASCTTEKSEISQSLENLLPRNDELAGWTLDGDPEVATGEDLYLLINGGAEIYHEYGFKRVVFQRYTHEIAGDLNVEIYEMDSPQAAYGIYTFKTGDEGKSIKFGNAGWLESYFLNYWKGNFLVTIIGMTPESDMADFISEMGIIIDLKISGQTKKPEIISYLPDENLPENGITYLKGSLALYNNYFFDTKNIFDFSDGVIGQYQEYSFFIFRYKSEKKQRTQYEIAKSSLQQNSQFSGFVDSDSLFGLRDPNGKQLKIKSFKNFIMIFLRKSRNQDDQIFQQIEARINQAK